MHSRQHRTSFHAGLKKKNEKSFKRACFDLKSTDADVALYSVARQSTLTCSFNTRDEIYHRPSLLYRSLLIIVRSWVTVLLESREQTWSSIFVNAACRFPTHTNHTLTHSVKGVLTTNGLLSLRGSRTCEVASVLVDRLVSPVWPPVTLRRLQRLVVVDSTVIARSQIIVEWSFREALLRVNSILIDLATFDAEF